MNHKRNYLAAYGKFDLEAQDSSTFPGLRVGQGLQASGIIIPDSGPKHPYTLTHPKDH